MKSYPFLSLVTILILWLIGCHPAATDNPPSTANPITEVATQELAPDSAMLAEELVYFETQNAISKPRKPADYVPIVRDTLINRGFMPALAEKLAQPLTERIGFDTHDIINVLTEDKRDLNGDGRPDRMIVFANGPYDGNGRGLTTLVLLSNSRNGFAGYATEPVWNGLQNKLPDLDVVRVSATTQRPYFNEYRALFPFTKL